MEWTENHVYACNWGYSKTIFINIFKKSHQAGIIIDCIYPRNYKARNTLIVNSILE